MEPARHCANAMDRPALPRSALVDASVNAVPLAILVFFVAFFLVYDPWPADPLAVVLEVGLHLVPILVLAVATLTAAWLIGADQRSDREG